MHRFCTPAIHPDGSIGMGESNECPMPVSVYDSNDTIRNSFRDSQCNDCGMLDKLSTMHHVAIRFYPEGK